MSKRKTVSKEFIDDSDDPEDTGSKAKKKAKTKGSTASSASEDEMIPLSTRRFVNVRSFNGKLLVDIREYYEDRGEKKPGKKGISLSLDQWEELKRVIPEVDAKIDGAS